MATIRTREGPDDLVQAQSESKRLAVDHRAAPVAE